MLKEYLIYYSINSWLAFKISEQYYHDMHYVWCSPFFNGNGKNPPSSNPIDIYHSFNEDVMGKDSHSAKIAQNKLGLIKSTEVKTSQGIISFDEQQEIIDIVQAATIEDFKPLIYVIPHSNVKSIIKKASRSVRANVFSEEYIIENLPRDCFDIISLDRGVKNV